MWFDRRLRPHRVALPPVSQPALHHDKSSHSPKQLWDAAQIHAQELRHFFLVSNNLERKRDITSVFSSSDCWVVEELDGTKWWRKIVDEWSWGDRGRCYPKCVEQVSDLRDQSLPTAKWVWTAAKVKMEDAEEYHRVTCEKGRWRVTLWNAKCKCVRLQVRWSKTWKLREWSVLINALSVPQLCSSTK